MCFVLIVCCLFQSAITSSYLKGGWTFRTRPGLRFPSKESKNVVKFGLSKNLPECARRQAVGRPVIVGRPACVGCLTFLFCFGVPDFRPMSVVRYIGRPVCVGCPMFPFCFGVPDFRPCRSSVPSVIRSLPDVRRFHSALDVRISGQRRTSGCWSLVGRPVFCRSSGAWLLFWLRAKN